MSLLIVASDSPGAGKTAATLALAQISNENGVSASAFKPFALTDDDPDQAVFNDLANPASRRLAYSHTRLRSHKRRRYAAQPRIPCP